MEPQNLSDLGQRAQALYERLRAKIETPENLGKIIVLDVDSEDWEIDELGIESAFRLKKAHPEAQLYALKIGFKYAVSFNGSLEPISCCSWRAAGRRRGHLSRVLSGAIE